MHNAVIKFLSSTKEKYPEIFKAERILECGSMNINGSARGFFENATEYIGIDWRKGDGVDVVSLIHEYNEKPDGYFDTAITTETLEHDPYWEQSLKKMLKKIRLDGSLIITCAGPHRHHHQFQASPEKNYYKNLNIEALRKVVLENSMFRKIEQKYSRLKDDIYMVCLEKTSNEGFPYEHLFLHLIKKHQFKRVAEIGVDRGMLAERVLMNYKPDVYYAVDPWKVYIESYDRPPHAKECQQEFWDMLYERVSGMKKKFPALEIMRMTSVTASKILIDKGEELDCVYIDAIHDPENIAKDVYCWLPLLKNGGILCGHDYIKRYTAMCQVLDKMFGDDLNYMLIDPAKPPLSYKNTYQGGNWWVELDKIDRMNLIFKIRDEFPEIVKSVEEEWKSV